MSAEMEQGTKAPSEKARTCVSASVHAKICARDAVRNENHDITRGFKTKSLGALKCSVQTRPGSHENTYCCSVITFSCYTFWVWLRCIHAGKNKKMNSQLHYLAVFWLSGIRFIGSNMFTRILKVLLCIQLTQQLDFLTLRKCTECLSTIHACTTTSLLVNLKSNDRGGGSLSLLMAPAGWQIIAMQSGFHRNPQYVQTHRFLERVFQRQVT